MSTLARALCQTNDAIMTTVLHVIIIEIVAALRCAALPCPALRCAVRCCAVLLCAVLYCAVLCCAELRQAVMCGAVLWHDCNVLWCGINSHMLGHSDPQQAADRGLKRDNGAAELMEHLCRLHRSLSTRMYRRHSWQSDESQQPTSCKLLQHAEKSQQSHSCAPPANNGGGKDFTALCVATPSREKLCQPNSHRSQQQQISATQALVSLWSPGDQL